MENAALRRQLLVLNLHLLHGGTVAGVEPMRGGFFLIACGASSGDPPKRTRW
jgi:hypothetical protein